MMKKLRLPIKIIGAICLSFWTTTAATLVWDEPAEQSLTNELKWVVHHNVFVSTNGSAFSSNRVEMPATEFDLGDLVPGTTYTFRLVAVDGEHLESEPSELVYTKPEVPSLVPPAINVTSVTISGTKAQVWQNTRVWFSTIDLSDYGATSYIVRAQPAIGAPFIGHTTSSPFNFPTLPVQEYFFSVTVTNSFGSSPPGDIYYLSGKAPGNPIGVIILAP